MGSKKNRLWFVLGRETKLSAAELISILDTAEFELDFGILKTRTNYKPKLLMSRLGGTIKIAEEIKTDLTEEELLRTIVEELKTTTGKITFGLSFYTPTEEGKNLPMIQNWGKRIKKILKDEDLRFRDMKTKMYRDNSAQLFMERMEQEKELGRIKTEGIVKKGQQKDI